MADEIRVIVCIPACSLRRQLTVSPSMTINALKQYLPNPDCDLLREGSILAEAMPLAFYSISDGSMLVAVSRGCLSSRDRWVHMTLDQEAFEERMGANANPQLAAESARLRDLRMRRVADRPSAWTRLRACVDEIEASRGIRAAPTPTVVPHERAAKPNCQPLPPCWAPAQTKRRPRAAH
jgi:hypothetical protein